jgi:hypothetical protein
MKLGYLGGVALAFSAGWPLGAAVVSVPNRTDQVYDDSRGLLYLSTNTGLVQRYNPQTNALLPAWTVGTNVSAIDITPDNQYLLAAENNWTGIGIIHRLNLNTGLVTDYTYDAPEGRAAYDIVALNDGRALFSGGHMYSGDATVLRSLDLNTGSISYFTVNGQTQYVQKNSELWRNRARNTVAIVDTATSAGGFSIYSTTTESYVSSTQFWTPLNMMRLSITPNSSQVAMAGFNLSAAVRQTNDLSVITALTDAAGGLAYDPTGTLLYDGCQTAGTIRIYRTSDYQIVGTVAPAGASLSIWDVPGSGMTVSGDGRWLFLYSSNGLNTYAVTPAPEAGTLLVMLAGAALLLRRVRGGTR